MPPRSTSAKPLQAGPLLAELGDAGFCPAEIRKAFDWLDALAEDRPAVQPPRAGGPVRVYVGAELEKLDADSRGFLMFLEQHGVLDAGQRELVLDRALALEQDDDRHRRPQVGRADGAVQPAGQRSGLRLDGNPDVRRRARAGTLAAGPGEGRRTGETPFGLVLPRPRPGARRPPVGRRHARALPRPPHRTRHAGLARGPARMAAARAAVRGTRPRLGQARREPPAAAATRCAARHGDATGVCRRDARRPWPGHGDARRAGPQGHVRLPDRADRGRGGGGAHHRHPRRDRGPRVPGLHDPGQARDCGRRPRAPDRNRDRRGRRDPRPLPVLRRGGGRERRRQRRLRHRGQRLRVPHHGAGRGPRGGRAQHRLLFHLRPQRRLGLHRRRPAGQVPAAAVPPDPEPVR